KAASGARLNAVVPRVVAELVSFDAALLQRIRHATHEAATERSRLHQHDVMMGTSAPTRRKNIEASIDEFENAVTLSQELLDATAAAQDALWTALVDVAPPSTNVVAGLQAECAAHWRHVDGPLRDVFVKFAQLHELPQPPTDQATTEATAAVVDRSRGVGGEDTRADEHVATPVAEPTTTLATAAVTGKFNVRLYGDEGFYVLYTRSDEYSFERCRVVEFGDDAKYTVQYEDGEVYRVAEPHLFTDVEYAHVMASTREEADGGGSTCVLM
ncbi:hypothetical protein DYB31_014747, partial [Aphanomyces astaci]